jgi:branched-chain amino acid transport system permease protein
MQLSSQKRCFSPFGALIVISMQNYLAQFGEWVTVIQGVVFVACVLAFRRGIVGELAGRAKLSL